MFESIHTVGKVIIGSAIGQQFDGTIAPSAGRLLPYEQLLADPHFSAERGAGFRSASEANLEQMKVALRRSQPALRLATFGGGQSATQAGFLSVIG